jgi:choline-sulfatase
MHRDGYDPYPLDEPKPTMTLGETRDVSRAHLERAGSFNPETTRATEHGYSPSHGLYFQDRQVLDWTRAFLRERGREVGGEPWALHVGFEYPHWPYVAPDEYFSMYYPDSVELPHDAVFPRNAGLPAALQEWQRWNDFGEVPEEMLRRVLAAYYGMVTCMDEMIGEIVAELESNGLADNTIILYTSDHGESLGEHGLFYKHSSARAAVGVPLLVAGPGIERGRVVRTPVSLVDLYPTVLDVYGLEVEADRPGESLIRLSKTGTDGAHAREAHAREARARDGVFAEWHGPGFRGAWYMLERLPYKYTWYESFPPTLYNVEADPKEDVNLADDPSYAGILSDFECALYEMLDVDTVSRKAKQNLGLITSDGIDLSKERPPT